MKKLFFALFICLSLASFSQGYNVSVRVFEVSHEAKNGLKCKGINIATGDTVFVEYYHRFSDKPKIEAGTILRIRAKQSDKQRTWYCRRIKILNQ